MGITPLTFTGVSKFSSDFQTILSRAVQIAQLPITALQNKDSDAIQKKNLLGGLQSAASGFSDSLKSLGSIAAHQAVSASSSNTAAVTVTATGAATAGAYTINSITSAATAASERTNSGFLDSAATPVSSTGDLNLVVGTNQFHFSLSNNTLVGLRDKINSLGAGVNATILTTSGGNYLSLSSNTTGASTLQLFDDPAGANTNLLTSTNQGTNAVFKLNGIDVSQGGNVVNSVIPGVTSTIQSPTNSPVTLSLSSDRSQLASALQNFADTYNTLKKQLSAQVGGSAGLLTGNIAVTQLQGLLRQITSYRGVTGSITSLSNLGIEFSSTGEASLNQTTFNQLSGSQITDAFAFVGSATTGLAGFSRNVEQFTDPITGIIKAEQNGLDRTDKTIQKQIAALTDRITIMQTGLAQRLQAADAALAQLQSQQNTISASLQSLNSVLYGKSPASN